MLSWFWRRWNEPESRAALAGALTMGAAWLHGTVSDTTMGYALLAAVFAFAFGAAKGGGNGNP